MKKLLVIFLGVMISMIAEADENIGSSTIEDCLRGIAIEDSIRGIAIEDASVSMKAKEKKKPIVMRMIDAVSDYLMECDTNYVTPIPYMFTAEMNTSYWHDYYQMRSSVTANRMIIQSDPSLVVGGYLYWSFLGYGLSYNLNDIGKPQGETNGTGIRQSLVANTAKFFAEYYRFNSGKTAEVTYISNMDITGKDNRFRGLDARCNGLSLMYIFNNKRFSWPAAYEGSAVQRRSCGSWSLGFQYNHQRIRFNKDELPLHLIGTIDPTLMFSEVNYNDYSINTGYSFNWVLKRNCMFGISAIPSLGYRRSNITEATNNHSILNNVSTDLNFRSSLVWNNTQWFTKLMLELHTYSYRKDKFGLTNTFGTLSFVVGFQFLEK